MQALPAKKCMSIFFILFFQLKSTSGKTNDIPPAACLLLHFSVSGITWYEDFESAYQSAYLPASLLHH